MMFIIGLPKNLPNELFDGWYNNVNVQWKWSMFCRIIINWYFSGINIQQAILRFAYEQSNYGVSVWLSTRQFLYLGGHEHITSFLPKSFSIRLSIRTHSAGNPIVCNNLLCRYYPNSIPATRFFCTKQNSASFLYINKLQLVIKINWEASKKLNLSHHT